MTLQAEQLISQRRNIENEIEVLEDSNNPENFGSELKELYSELKSIVEVCEQCEGEGEIIDYNRINHTTIDVPYKTCSYCHGQGTKN